MKYKNIDPDYQQYVTEDRFIGWQASIAKNIEKDQKTWTYEDFEYDLLMTYKQLKKQEEQFSNKPNAKDAERIVQLQITIYELDKIVAPEKIKRIDEAKKTPETAKSKFKTHIPQRTIENPIVELKLPEDEEIKAQQEEALLKYDVTTIKQLFEPVYVQITANAKCINPELIMANDLKLSFKPIETHLQLTTMERQKLINNISKRSIAEIDDEIAKLNKILETPVLLKKYKKQMSNSPMSDVKKDAITTLVELLYTYKYFKFMKESYQQQQLQQKQSHLKQNNMFVKSKTPVSNDNTAQQKDPVQAFNEALPLNQKVLLEQIVNPTNPELPNLVERCVSLLKFAAENGIQAANDLLGAFYPDYQQMQLK